MVTRTFALRKLEHCAANCTPSFNTVLAGQFQVLQYTVSQDF